MKEQVFLGIKGDDAVITKAEGTDQQAASDLAYLQIGKELGIAATEPENVDLDALYVVHQIPMKPGETFKLTRI